MRSKRSSWSDIGYQNYVIQFVLEHGAVEDRHAIIGALSGHMLNMARHKFASNVCEKALVTSDSASRRILIAEILSTRPDGQNVIVIMMKDQYASEFRVSRADPTPI